MEWHRFDDGKTTGTKGSENGSIVDDIEHIDGVRITLEKNCDVAPFAITFGIYGLMFHTNYVGTEENARNYIELIKEKISAFLLHWKVPDEKQDEHWNDKFNWHMEDLIV